MQPTVHAERIILRIVSHVAVHQQGLFVGTAHQPSVGSMSDAKRFFLVTIVTHHAAEPQLFTWFCAFEGASCKRKLEERALKNGKECQRILWAQPFFQNSYTDICLKSGTYWVCFACWNNRWKRTFWHLQRSACFFCLEGRFRLAAASLCGQRLQWTATTKEHHEGFWFGTEFQIAPMFVFCHNLGKICH